MPQVDGPWSSFPWVCGLLVFEYSAPALASISKWWAFLVVMALQLLAVWCFGCWSCGFPAHNMVFTGPGEEGGIPGEDTEDILHPLAVTLLLLALTYRSPPWKR